MTKSNTVGGLNTEYLETQLKSDRFNDGYWNGRDSSYSFVLELTIPNGTSTQVVRHLSPHRIVVNLQL